MSRRGGIYSHPSEPLIYRPEPRTLKILLSLKFR